MDELKVIAGISKRAGSSVERVGSTGPRSSSVLSKAARILRTAQFRRKLMAISQSTQSALTQHLLARNFEQLKQPHLFEYGPSFKWEWSAESLTFITSWLDGEILADESRRREPLWSLSSENLWQRLRIWARAFERLAQWHAVGIVHGNLKPQNILICDALDPDVARHVPTEFFTRDESVPYVALLDGGYAHLLEAWRDVSFPGAGEERGDETFWRPPEALSLVEGAVTASSDVYSLAAIMAFDLGLVWMETEDERVHGVLQCLWPIFTSETGWLHLHRHRIAWHGKSPLCDGLRRVKALLAKALDPLPERRSRNAREIAFELLVVTRRLSGLHDEETRAGLEVDPLPDAECTARMRTETTRKFVPLPPGLQESLDTCGSAGAVRRFWVVARNAGINVHNHIRKLSVRLALDGFHFLTFRIRHTEESFPFSALDAFISLLLTKIQRRNSNALAEARRELASQRQALRLAREVLPALGHLMGASDTESSNFGEMCLTARHESLHLAIDGVLRTLFGIARLDAIVIDDLQRADLPSLRVFLRHLANGESDASLWILGARSFENPPDEELSLALRRLMASDRCEDVLETSERGIAWNTRLNNLPPEQARFLGALTSLPLPLSLRDVGEIATDACSIKGLLSNEFHHGKSSLPHLPADAIGEAIPIRSEGAEAEAADLALEALRAAKDMGILVEERETQSGRIHSLHWVSERVSLMLMLLLNSGLREQLFLKTAERLATSPNRDSDWSEILREAEIFIGTNPERTAHATFSALMQASERLLDFDSCAHLMSRFETLEDRLSRRRSIHAETLIPKIRERIADLAALRGETENARKFYTSVLINTDDPKRRAVIALKSFVPAHVRNRGQRLHAFQEILREAQEAGFVARVESNAEFARKELPHLVQTIEIMLAERSALSGRELLVRPLVELIDLTQPERFREGLVYPTHSKAQRAQVLSQFARAVSGWIDGAHMAPIVAEALGAALDERHGIVIAEALLTACITYGANLSPEVRMRALKATAELGARTGNEQFVLESALLRAWFSFFADGNLRDAHLQIESLRSRTSEMPRSYRGMLEKMRILFEFETQAREKILHDSALARNRLRERFAKAPFVQWPVGEAYLSTNSQVVELAGPGPEPTLPELISDQTDQTLLYLMLSLERGSAGAAQACIAAATASGAREWLSDPDCKLVHLPASIEQALAQRNTIVLERQNLAAADPEILLRLGEASLENGYQWLAHRFCTRSGTQLETLVRGHQGAHADAVPESHVPPANEAVALNYVLEFLHRFQWNLMENGGPISNDVSLALEKSIPPHQDLVEGTIAQAVASAARRLKIRDEASKGEGNLAESLEERRTG